MARSASSFLLSLVLVQWLETARRAEESGLRKAHVSVPSSSESCVDCHSQGTPGIIDHWEGSTHAEKGVGCVECHTANKDDADAFEHYGVQVATVVTPRDCAQCHVREATEFGQSHHAAAGNILASLDNFLAETVEGAREPFNPHSPTPGRAVDSVNGLASAFTGCQQCHGSKVGLLANDGSPITVDDLQPDENGIPTNRDAVARIAKDENGKPKLHAGSWPNTGIGRLNLDGSLGSCSACHSRHDFSPRRARQPENCGKCHLGPDHPQKEIFEESKHGVAYRDLKDDLNLDGESWVLGRDYAAAPTCATCHMSANLRNGETVTHDPGERISWTNRPPVSLVMDTDINGSIVKTTDPAERERLVVDTWEDKRGRMKQVCSHCHTPDYISGFYEQYDDLVILYNEKFAKPGQQIMAALVETEALTHEDAVRRRDRVDLVLPLAPRRAAERRHGASMMAPDYTHWHGMYEVAERFYMELVPQTRELIEEGRRDGHGAGASRVAKVLDDILSRPEHAWFEEGAENATERVREEMERRYGQEGG